LHGASYDTLSDRGREQSYALGQYWADRGLQFDQVYIGPRQRHRETALQVASAYRACGLLFPDPILCPLLDEHDGVAVLKRAAGIHEKNDQLMSGDSIRDASLLHHLGRYREVMSEWAAGDYEADHIEPWAAFRARAGDALDLLTHGTGRCAAFTSGGLIAAIIGTVLQLDDRRVIDLSATAFNTGLTELHRSTPSHGLITFNAVPHLRDSARITRV
jgi:broad specificity phosphatase PhoE